MVIRIERLRFEQFVIAGDNVRDVVVIRPCDRCPNGNFDVCRAKTEIVDLDRGAPDRILSGSQSQNRPDSCSESERSYYRCDGNENPPDSFHVSFLQGNILRKLVTTQD
jgi:hypothetical protein